MQHDHLSSILNQKIQVLTLVQDEENGDFTWSSGRKHWASVDLNTKNNLFSSIGIGARGAVLTIRPDSKLTLHQALEWDGQFLFLTSIILSQERDRQTIQAALCNPVTLTADPQDRTGRDELNRPKVVKQASFSFPGILTELYHGNAADEIYRTDTLQRVMVTPKAVVLRAGDLVHPENEAPYTVRQVLDLDPWKNEYVIERQEDI